MVGALAVTLAIGGLFALGALQRWNDPGHCWKWTPGKVRAGPAGANGKPLPLSRQPASFRAAVERCIEIRRTHRSGPFGAFTTRNDRTEIACEYSWARLGELIGGDDAWVAEAMLTSYGIDGRLDPSKPADKGRFMDACVPGRTPTERY